MLPVAPTLFVVTKLMTDFAVVPVLIGPMQVLLTILPGLILAALSALISLLHPRAVWNTLKVLWRQKIQVAIVLVVLGGLAWTGKHLWSKWQPLEETATAQAGRDWPMSRGSLDRRGVVAGDHGPARGGVNWARKFADKEVFLSTAAIVGNRAYVAAGDLFWADQPNYKGKLYCFDTDTGAKVWELAPGGPPKGFYRATFSSPVVSGHYLVCGEGLHDTRPARIVCLDLRNERQPTVAWTHITDWHVECTPVIAEGRVYVNAGDGGIYCLALEGGPDGESKLLWHVGGTSDPDRYPDAETALAVYHGKVYVGLGRGGNALVELDGATGKELRRLHFDQPIFSPPAIVHGKLYIATGYGDFIMPWKEACEKLKEKLKRLGKSQEQINDIARGMVESGKVCCVDVAKFTVDWTFTTKQLVLGTVVVAGDQLYCGSRDGTVYCLSRKGQLLASWNSFAPIPASPAVTEQYVYVVNTNGMLFALDRERLEPVWQLRLGAPGNGTFNYLSSPTVAHGRVYVGTPYDGFVCAGEPGEKQTTPRWPGPLGGGGRAGNADESSIPSEVFPLWQFSAPVRAPAAVLDERLLVPVAEGPVAGLLAFPVGARAAKDPEPAWQAALPLGVHASPVGQGNNVWCVDGRIGDDGRQLHTLDAKSGQAHWKAPLAAQASGVLLATSDALLVQDGEDVLSSFGHEGERQWSQKIGKLEQAPTVTKTMIVAATVQPRLLLVLDRPTGRILWRQPLETSPTASPVVRKDRIYLGTHARLEARSLLDGSPIADWQGDGGGVSADFALLRDMLVYVNHAGELVVVSAGNGAVLLRLPNALAGRSPLVSRDTVVYAARLAPAGKELPPRTTAPLPGVAGGAGATAVRTYPGREGLMRIVLHRDLTELFVAAAGVGAGPPLLAQPAVAITEEPQLWSETTDFGRLKTPLILFNGQVYGGTGAGLVRWGKE